MLGMLRIGNARKETLAGVRRANFARLFAAVERNRVRPDVFAPEGPVELFAQFLGPMGEFGRSVRLTQQGRQRGARPPRGIDVALHFAERDRPLGKRAVGVKDGVVGILPALMDQAVGRLPVIFDEPVAVGIAVLLDPAQGRLDVRPQLLDERAIGRPLVVGAGQEHEERRGVDAAVVFAERHLAKSCHFAAPRFVQDFAGLGILLREHFGGLGRCQIREHPLRKLGAHPQTLERGDDAVAAEGRVEPRNAGIRIGSARQLGRQHVQVGHRPVDPGVDLAVRRPQVARPGGEPLEIGLDFAASLLEPQHAGRATFNLAGDRERQRPLLLGL